MSKSSKSSNLQRKHHCVHDHVIVPHSLVNDVHKSMKLIAVTKTYNRDYTFSRKFDCANRITEKVLLIIVAIAANYDY